MLQLLGGSVGIAVINTFVARRIALHKVDLTENLSFYNPASNERLNGLISQLTAGGKNYEEARTIAMGIMEGTMNLQASVIGYSEGFLAVGIICAVMLPLVFFAKIKKGEATAVGGGH